MTLDLAVISFMWQKTQSRKEKLNFNKIKNLLCTSKDSEKTTHGMGKNIENHLSDKELISRIYHYSHF